MRTPSGLQVFESCVDELLLCSGPRKVELEMVVMWARQLSRLVMVLVLGSAVFLSPQQALAQAQDPLGGSSALDARKAVGTILLSGLVGGILGLSTLSFYSAPEDHIRNISFGAGIGIIAAAMYLTFDVANTPLPQASGPFYWKDQNAWLQEVALVPSFDLDHLGAHLHLKW